MSTTVLATAMAMPTTTPAVGVQPNHRRIAVVAAVATALWMIAPGSAMRRTAQRSLTWKCSPTPNIRRITPSSASCWAAGMSPTNPGVYGPITMPARR